MTLPAGVVAFAEELRAEMKASRVPSGEKSGRCSVAESSTTRCAGPPRAGATQIRLPETQAICGPSKEVPGSASDGFGGAGACAQQVTASSIAARIQLFAPLFTQSIAASLSLLQ